MDNEELYTIEVTDKQIEAVEVAGVTQWYNLIDISTTFSRKNKCYGIYYLNPVFS